MEQFFNNKIIIDTLPSGVYPYKIYIPMYIKGN